MEWAETFTRLAGLGKDPSRRVTQPVSLSIDITSASVPLDRSMRPQLASAAIDAKGALSAVQFESVDAAGTEMALTRKAEGRRPEHIDLERLGVVSHEAAALRKNG